MLAVILASGIFLGSATSTALHATKKAKRIYQTIQIIFDKYNVHLYKNNKKKTLFYSFADFSKNIQFTQIKEKLLYKSFASVIPFHQF